MVDVQEIGNRIVDNVEQVIVGKRPEVQMTVLGLLSQGHILIEDVPGVGKTVLAKSLARSVGCSFQRIQFTPDMLPSDITGVSVFNVKTREFEFRPGPIHAQIVLVDEINRATPKTQSALLEAMQEGTVTVSGVTYPLERPFFVLATQNPIEMEGTYPLPEAQVDRFFFKLLVNPPGTQELKMIVERTTGDHEPVVNSVLTREELLSLQRVVREVPVASHVVDLAVHLVQATHPASAGASADVKRYVRYGSSPRGAQALILAAKARALIRGRFNAAVEDVVAVAPPALRHRIILSFEAEAEGVDVHDLLDVLIERAKKEVVV